MANEIRFDGRVAIVTGAGAGLGRTYALELARRGAKVVVNDYGGARDGAGAGSASPADAVVKEIKDKGGQAAANYDNVATVEGGEGIVKTALDAFGTIDVLVNNAGILRDKGMLKMEPENWKAVVAVHLYGAYNVTKPAFAIMREKSYGRIVMTSSASGIYGNFGQTNYGAAKVALVGFMNTLKLEGGKYNVKVNTVAPSAISRLTEDVLPPDLASVLKPEFVMPLVVYLCSEECPVSGNAYHAMLNSYNRVAIMTNPGLAIADGKRVPSVEEVAAKWDKIANMAGAKEYPQLNDLSMAMLTAIQANA